MKSIRWWFWSPIRDNENWVQTLMRIIGSLARTFLTVVLLLAFPIGVASYLQAKSDDQNAPESRRVFVTVSTDQTNPFYSCSPEYPVSIAVRNDSSQTLMSMDIEVTARVSGTSTNVLTYDERRLRWDQIVPPEHALAMCYRIGHNRLDAYVGFEDERPIYVFTAEPVFYTVNLRPTERWMLSETRASKLAPP